MSWKGNFRDLGGAVIRMATLAQEGRITAKEAGEEIAELRSAWGESTATDTVKTSLGRLIGQEKVDQLDLFDQKTLEAVIETCLKSVSLADAGRALFQVSRQKKKTVNDSDRLLKYLSKYNLTWQDIVTFKGSENSPHNAS